MLKNNLISLLDTVFPGANRLFSSPPREDGSEKWVDFVGEFWHCRCVSSLSEKAFQSRYLKWCRKHGYHFSEDKTREIYALASSCVGPLPMGETTSLLVKQAVSRLQTVASSAAALRQEMQALSQSLPEYHTVMSMYGVGPSLGPQLIDRRCETLSFQESIGCLCRNRFTA